MAWTASTRRRVDVKLVDPLQRVVDEEPAHVIAVRAVEVERRPPRRLVPVGEVRAVLAEVVPLGTEVVVDDVEERGRGRAHGTHRPAASARAVRRTSSAPRRCTCRRSPSCACRETGAIGISSIDGDAELPQRVEPRDDRLERSLGGERADMQLVDDVVVERDAAPLAIRPDEVVARRPRSRPCTPSGCSRDAGSGRSRPADVEEVPRPLAALDDRLVIAVVVLRHRDALLLRRDDVQLDAIAIRRPDAELTRCRRRRARRGGERHRERGIDSSSMRRDSSSTAEGSPHSSGTPPRAAEATS